MNDTPLTSTYVSPIGEMLLIEESGCLTELRIISQASTFRVETETYIECKTPLFAKTKAWLDRYFAGTKPAISELSLAPRGSVFRQAVWKHLCEIPYGEVITYGALAAILADDLHKEKMAAQAVGGAVGANPIPIIIPCHRVIGVGGNLTGFAYGLPLKIALLRHENVDMTAIHLPQ